jgi:hypothetical protein
MFWEIGASLLGGILGDDAAGDASAAQAGATAASIAEQRRQYDQTRQDYAPQRQYGGNALQQLAWEMGLLGNGRLESGMDENQLRQMLTPQFTRAGTSTRTPYQGHITYGPEGNFDDDEVTGRGSYTTAPSVIDETGLQAEIQRRMAQGGDGFQAGPSVRSQDDLRAEALKEPGYQFGLQQGQQAIDRKAAAAGGRVSGAALKAANRFATDYATSGYNAAYGRREDRLARLQTLAGYGNSATGSVANAGQNSTNAISQAMQSQGDAFGAARLASGNIWQNTANQIGAIGSRAFQTPSYINPATSAGYGWGANYDK